MRELIERGISLHLLQTRSILVHASRHHVFQRSPSLTRTRFAPLFYRNLEIRRHTHREGSCDTPPGSCSNSGAKLGEVGSGSPPRHLREAGCPSSPPDVIPVAFAISSASPNSLIRQNARLAPRLRRALLRLVPGSERFLGFLRGGSTPAPKLDAIYALHQREIAPRWYFCPCLVCRWPMKWPTEIGRQQIELFSRFLIVVSRQKSRIPASTASRMRSAEEKNRLTHDDEHDFGGGLVRSGLRPPAMRS